MHALKVLRPADAPQIDGLTTSQRIEPVTDAYGTTLTGMGCGGAVVREDGMKLAIVHSISTDVSFVVADVTVESRLDVVA